ncbi:PAS domain S-box protein [bacterium]
MKLTKKIIFLVIGAGLIWVAAAVLIFQFNLPFVPLIVLALLLSTLLAYVLARMITNPILRLNEGVHIVQAGNLEYHVDQKTDDEIGELSKAFQKMANDLINASTTIYDYSHTIEENKKNENGLKERGEHFWRLFEHSNNATFIHNFDGSVLDVNSKACEILGYLKSDLLKMSFFDLYDEEELSKSKAAFKSGEQTYSVVYESKFRRANGASIHVEVHSTVIDLKQGIMQTIVIDISHRKEMEEALRESEKKFRTFMETASDLMFITDEAGDFAYVNESLLTTLGYTRKEIIGKSMSELLENESFEEFESILKTIIEKSENHNELVWMTKDGTIVNGEMKTAGLYDDNGEFQGMSGVFRDITERKKVEESQRLAQLGKLSADVAHEVKNQMTAIYGLAELSLFADSPPEEMKENMQIILDQCVQANDIVKRLLKFSKPSPNIYKEVNIHDILNMVIDLVGKRFMKDKIEIEKKYAESLPSVKVDEKQMQEVFLNLLQNSAEAMDGGGQIDITTYQNDGDIQIHVKDSGGGISEEAMKKIFDPFFTTKETGTGLGLSVCYGICKAHGGDLRYSSVQGEGTTATVVLPLAIEENN